MSDNVVVIIPARYGSSRLPGKALAGIGGVPMVVRVYQQARTIDDVDVVVIATDDSRIVAAIEDVGGRAVMTRPDHPTGTDRVAEVAEDCDAGIIVNVQGDLPFLDPRVVLPMVALLRRDPELPMATMMTPIRDTAEWEDPSVVKITTDRNGHALYFSRRSIPWGGQIPGDAAGGAAGGAAMRHIGLYAYRRGFLSTFARLEPTPLERAERLEQLRALEHGYRIGVGRWDGSPVLEVNTPEELERANAVAWALQQGEARAV